MAATKQGAGSSLITLNLIDIRESDDAYAYAATLQKLNNLSTHVDNTANVLRAQIIDLLRKEGLDGNYGGLRNLLSGGDVVRTADKVIQPLRAIVHDAENIAKNGHVFRNRIDALVFDPVRLAKKLREQQGGRGLVVR